MAYLVRNDLDLDAPEDYDDEAFSRILSEMDDDEEGWEDEAFGEARRPKQYHRKYQNGRGSTRDHRMPSRKPVAGLRGGAIQTPAGQAQFDFKEPVATKKAVEELARDLRKEISLVAEAAKKVDQTVDKNTGILDKKVAEVTASLKKSQQQAQYGMLMPLLLSQAPQIEKVKFVDASAGQTPAGQTPKVISQGDTVSIETTTYKKDNNLLLPILMMTMMGGMGGNGSGDSSNMMLMVLALSGGLGGSNK